MRTIRLYILAIVSIFVTPSCIGQKTSQWDSISMSAKIHADEFYSVEIKQLTELYIEGLDRIRRDAIRRGKFRYALSLKRDINNIRK